MTTATPRTYVTVALPYANGPLHLGHLVEMIDADVWVRSQRAQGRSVLFASGNDAHGTPIMLHAQKKNMEPKDLVTSIHELHSQVINKYQISFDIYGRTDTEINKKWCYSIYETLKNSNIFKEQEIEQFFDEKANMFLPDRFVKGTCPKCHSPDQNGDHCDACGATYDPTDLIAPYSTLTKERPVMRAVSHLFVQLEPYREWLKEFLPGKISTKIISKFKEWLDAPLCSWDITRDAPYYGIPIPDRPGQYFYVWFDAPIGYIALFDQLSSAKGFSFEDFFHPDSQLIHFIGKDISYFHGIFWPIVLKAANLPLPAQVYVHGFLTLNGEKMSKSRGIVCDPDSLAEHIPTDCIRYYLASKMHASIDDINFDIAECVEKINSDLVGKSLNILSRSSKLLFDYFDGHFSAEVVHKNAEISAEFVDEIQKLYQERQYQSVVQNIMKEMTTINEELTIAAPWSVLKQDPKDLASWSALSRAAKAFYELMLLLEPILPTLAQEIKSHYASDRLAKPYTILLNRLDKNLIKGALTMSTTSPESSSAATAPAVSCTPLKADISFDTFSQVDLRVGRVLECHAVEKSEKLLCLKVDIGVKVVQIFSGIKAYVKPEDLVGKDVVICANLAPRKMSVGLSEGMLLSIHNGPDLIPLTSSQPVLPGSMIS